MNDDVVGNLTLYPTPPSRNQKKTSENKNNPLYDHHTPPFVKDHEDSFFTNSALPTLFATKVSLEEVFMKITVDNTIAGGASSRETPSFTFPPSFSSNISYPCNVIPLEQLGPLGSLKMLVSCNVCFPDKILLLILTLIFEDISLELFDTYKGCDSVSNLKMTLSLTGLFRFTELSLGLLSPAAFGY